MTPILGFVAQRVYDELTPVAYDDERQGWALAYFIAAIAVIYEVVYEWAGEGQSGEPGWSILLDVDRAPLKVLPWLGQFVGVTTPHQNAGESDEDYVARMRTAIKEEGGWKRGRPASIIAAAQVHLSGSKQVVMRERYGSPYRLTVLTKNLETPNVELVRQAILAQKPAALVLDYRAVPLIGDYQQILDDYATYQDLLDAFGTYGDMVDPGSAGPLYPEPSLYPDPTLYPSNV